MQWHETDLLVESLEENYPDIEVEELNTADLYELILDLPDFSDDPDSKKEKQLTQVLEAWIEHRREI